MFPPFWGFPTSANPLLEEIQRELDRMRNRWDVGFRTLLNADRHPVACTPADVVYDKDNLQLLHYHPVVDHPYPVPLLIVPSLLSRSDLLDLMPGRSLVEYLVGQGIDVYMINWGTPRPEYRSTTFDQYITGNLRRAVQRVCAQSGQQQISLLGYSMGGVFTAIFSALYPHYVSNLIQVAAPVNFHDEGVFSRWTRKDRFNVDLVVDTLGAMPVALMQASFRMLKPLNEIVQQIALAEQRDDIEVLQDWLMMQTWIDDNIPFLGEAYRSYIKDCYQENALVQGRLVVSGKRVKLSLIAAALLTITAAKDQMCPPQSAAVLNDLVASTDKQLLEAPGGHISLVAGRAASHQLWPRIAEWLAARSATQPFDAVADEQ